MVLKGLINRVRCCPREIEKFDDAEKFPVSNLRFEDPDTERETEIHYGITDAPTIDVVEAEAAKQKNSCHFVGARDGSHRL